MEKSSAFQRWNNYMWEQNEKAETDHEENLLPCPFCGGEAFLEVIPPHQHHFVKLPPYGGGAFVECKGCTCAMSAKTSGEVIAAWNRRAQPEQSDVVHGRWETVELYGETARYQCTACKEEMIDHINREGYHRYCHKCGAKMEEAR